ncbi:MAG TPA: glucose-6-phosphate dehydrogenase assembly protein OpcA [Solirubrobacteraceae bacterium]|jgi:glucose-6-phosphate dehydrogenase assembly protein OpcA
MSEDVWTAQDTTPDEIESALRRLLRERHAANPSIAPARVLNLVVVVDSGLKGEIAERLSQVGRYNASRTILCSVEEGRDTLDAVAVMSYDESPGGSLTVVHERVEIDIGPEHLARLDTIVDPVLVSEITTMLWAPHGHDEAASVLMPFLDVILMDSDDQADAGAGFARAEDCLREVYVVDLAWLRTTPWRERLAASFDPPDRRAGLARLNEVSVRHAPSSKASASLLVGWLCSRLDWNGERPGIQLDAVEQEAPGLAGVTVSWGEESSLSLDRGRGGLLARERGADGQERVWRVLGSSRGEGGILGEGVRQALLRDPTYGPALIAAQEVCTV